MKLLTFAHRKEAQVFIHHFNFEMIPFHFDGLFYSNNMYLLITGEGMQSASEKTTAVLSVYAKEITEVFNLGVAGSVSKNILKDEIYAIRTCYAKPFEHIEFKSFSSKNQFANIDCMTINTRAISLNIRKELSMFANIIDREAWAIGSSAYLFKKSFQAIKYISDDLNSENFCQLIIEDAPLISKKLLDYFLANYFKENTQKIVASIDSFYSDKTFYFTVTHKRIFEQTLKNLKIKDITFEYLLNDPKINEIKAQDILPKERTKILLNYLTELLNPIHRKINHELHKVIGPYKINNIEIQYDRQFESGKMLATIAFENRADLEKNLKTLKEFPIEKIEKIFNGQFDV
jgi:hypothetical protein